MGGVPEGKERRREAICEVCATGHRNMHIVTVTVLCNMCIPLDVIAQPLHDTESRKLVECECENTLLIEAGTMTLNTPLKMCL